MKKPHADSDFLARPGRAESWLRSSKPAAGVNDQAYNARLTIDVTTAMRRRLKLAALTQGVSVADLMRTLIDQHFPDTNKEPTG